VPPLPVTSGDPKSGIVADDTKVGWMPRIGGRSWSCREGVGLDVTMESCAPIAGGMGRSPCEEAVWASESTLPRLPVAAKLSALWLFACKPPIVEFGDPSRLPLFTIRSPITALNLFLLFLIELDTALVRLRFRPWPFDGATVGVGELGSSSVGRGVWDARCVGVVCWEAGDVGGDIILRGVGLPLVVGSLAGDMETFAKAGKFGVETLSIPLEGESLVVAFRLLNSFPKILRLLPLGFIKLGFGVGEDGVGVASVE
jgi:hypothetical protein